MTNISNYTSEHNPYVRTRRQAMSGFDTWTMIAAYSRTPTSGLRFRIFFATAAAVLADGLTAIPRHACDRLFAMNDAEAQWRGWQTTSLHGGFSRRYRDPMFDTLKIGASGAAPPR